MGHSGTSAVRHLGFLKLNFLTAGALQTDKYASTLLLSFYRLNTLPDAQLCYSIEGNAI